MEQLQTGTEVGNNRRHEGETYKLKREITELKPPKLWQSEQLNF